MTVISHGVLVFASVFRGSPITITDGGPNAGKVASRLVPNWRGRAYTPSATLVKSGGGTPWCIRNSVFSVTSSSGVGVLLHPGQTLSWVCEARR
jgi:hypothetical protein